MGAYLNAFFNDTRVQIALLVLVLDFVLGICAALFNKEQAFRLSYVSDTLRTDVLGKVVPFFVLYGGYLYASGADIVIPGLDMEMLMNAAWGVMLLALVGSILNSVTDLGILKGLPGVVAGGDPVTPTPIPDPSENVG